MLLDHLLGEYVNFLNKHTHHHDGKLLFYSSTKKEINVYFSTTIDYFKLIQSQNNHFNSKVV